MPQWPVMAHEVMHQQPPQDVGVALGGDDSSLERSSTKGKERQEAYEMHPVDGGHGGMGIYSPGESSRSPQQNQGYFVDSQVYSGYYGILTEDERRALGNVL